MSEQVIDIAFNWHQVNRVYARKYPTLSFMDRAGLAITDGPLTVLLRKGQYGDRLEIRDWLHERGCNYKMFGRYRLVDIDWTTEKRFVGLNFVFENTEESCLFRLFWGGSPAG